MPRLRPVLLEGMSINRQVNAPGALRRHVHTDVRTNTHIPQPTLMPFFTLSERPEVKSAGLFAVSFTGLRSVDSGALWRQIEAQSLVHLRTCEMDVSQNAGRII